MCMLPVLQGDVCFACLTWVKHMLPVIHGDVYVACLTWVMCSCLSYMVMRVLPILHG